MTTDRRDVDDLLRDLTQALTVEPAQHFETRARVHLLRRRRADRRAIFLGLVVVGAIAALVVVTPRLLPETQPVLPEVPRIVRDMTVNPQAPKRQRVSRPKPSNLSRDVPRVAESVFAFEVIVPDDQRVALRQLLQAAQAGREAVKAAEPPAVDERTGELLPPAPIVVPPLAPIPPLERTEGGAGRSR